MHGPVYDVAIKSLTDVRECIAHLADNTPGPDPDVRSRLLERFRKIEKGLTDLLAFGGDRE